MSFRNRLLVSFFLAVLLPIIVLAFIVRGEMTRRFTAQYERRVESMVSVIEEQLVREAETIAASLVVLRENMAEDNRFLRAAVDGAERERRYLLDYAGRAMRMTGLSMLQIQDESGRIISSGHFRNEYDREEPQLPRLLSRAAGGAALVVARTPGRPFLALARVDSARFGDRKFALVAGRKAGQQFLSQLGEGDQLTVSLEYPGGVVGPILDPGPSDAIVRVLETPFIDGAEGRVTTAYFRVSHDLAELRALRRSVDRWFMLVVAATLVLSVLVVGWLTSRISRPIVELSEKTSRIDLDRLDVDFDTRRDDEIGALSRMMNAMTQRLRASTTAVKDAERRATLGELARQVNHDIKNGLTPIRNVFRHLTDLSRKDPGKLPEVFAERERTLDTSMSYLEELAANYARLSRGPAPGSSCNLNDVVRQVIRERAREGVDLRVELGEGSVVQGDTVSLRRVTENLVSNAMESGAQKVVVSTAFVDGDGACVRLVVEDTGSGMTDEQREKIFDDFYTTKDHGTGLGLSIVRRLVMDMGGAVRVESAPGKGSRFIVEIPGANK